MFELSRIHHPAVTKAQFGPIVFSLLMVLAACGGEATMPPGTSPEGERGPAKEGSRDGAADPNPPDADERTDSGPEVASPKGWKLTPENTGLARVGLTCEGLPPYAGGSKPAPGTVITGQRIETTLDLSAGNIVIERSCIRPKAVGRGMPLTTTTDYSACGKNGCAVAPAMVTVRDSEIDGSLLTAEQVGGACAFLGVGTLLRNYMHDMGSGICFFNTGDRLDAIAEGNYVHRLRAFGDPATDGSHNESLTVRDFETTARPERRCVIRNNRLDSSSGNDSGAIFIQTYGGGIDQVSVEGNLLEGGAYQLVLEAGFGNIYGQAMRASDNRFSGTGYGPGYVERRGLSYGWSIWLDNHIDDPAKTDNKGRAIPSL